MNEERTLEVEIEPGVRDGMEYPFIGEGEILILIFYYNFLLSACLRIPPTPACGHIVNAHTICNALQSVLGSRKPIMTIIAVTLSISLTVHYGRSYYEVA